MANVKENIKFIKMHGLGNDFVIIDNREKNQKFSKDTVKKLSNRKTGIGCDQLIILEFSKKADVLMKIYNANGSEAEACGNATRCVAGLLMDKEGGEEKRIETVIGVLKAERSFSKKNKTHWGKYAVKVDMGTPSFNWQDIPLSYEMDTLNLAIPEFRELKAGVALNIGNPHIVFFVDHPEEVEPEISKAIECHRFFPNHINVGFAHVLSDDLIRLRVWERGVGLTDACGTGACASLIAAVKRGLIKDSAFVSQKGGSLFIEWKEPDHLTMAGRYSYSYGFGTKWRDLDI